jgi:glutamate/tyrosine decarboxylase-like PLP-dependent enzyme
MRYFKMNNKPCPADETSLKAFFLGPQAENAEWAKDMVNQIFSNWTSWRRSCFPEDGQAISYQDTLLPEFVTRQKNTQILLQELTDRFRAEIPKFSPRYISHMVSEISMPAMFGHILTLLHNPNNVARESSAVGLEIEKEAIEMLSEMVGFSHSPSYGHFTSGGTVSNYEAILRAKYRQEKWIAVGALAKQKDIYNGSLFQAGHMGWEKFRELTEKLLEIFSNNEEELQDTLVQYSPTLSTPSLSFKNISRVFNCDYIGPVILIPGNKHYSFEKAVSFFGLGLESLWSIHLDDSGRLDPIHLKTKIDEAKEGNRPILGTVSIAGTTELGEIDPIDDVQNLLDSEKDNNNLHIWHHVDAAYGGYFCCLVRSHDGGKTHIPNSLNSKTRKSLEAIKSANSVTLDPHKLGYVPYSSGAILISNKDDDALPSIDAPYLDFDRTLDVGIKTLEGSRSATGAVATWLSAKTLGLDQNGYGRILDRNIRARIELGERLQNLDGHIVVMDGCDTNVLCFHWVDNNILNSNKINQSIFENFSPCSKPDYFVSKTTLAPENYNNYINKIIDTHNMNGKVDNLTLIRVCLLNPFFDNVVSNTNYMSDFVNKLEQHLLSIGAISNKPKFEYTDNHR